MIHHLKKTLDILYIFASKINFLTIVTAQIMKKDDILSLFEKFNSLNTLIIGDVMIDTYFWGKVDRISPEAPVPIISRTDIEHRLGGAANVARNINALGANPILCSVIVMMTKQIFSWM